MIYYKLTLVRLSLKYKTSIHTSAHHEQAPRRARQSPDRIELRAQRNICLPKPQTASMAWAGQAAAEHAVRAAARTDCAVTVRRWCRRHGVGDSRWCGSCSWLPMQQTAGTVGPWPGQRPHHGGVASLRPPPLTNHPLQRTRVSEPGKGRASSGVCPPARLVFSLFFSFFFSFDQTHADAELFSARRLDATTPVSTVSSCRSPLSVSHRHYYALRPSCLCYA